MFGIEGGLALGRAVEAREDDPLAGPIGDILAGRPGRATAPLAAAGRDGDAATRARAVAWRGYAVGLRVNTFPGGTVANGIEVIRRWPAAWEGSPAPVPEPPEVAVECELVGRLLPRLRLVRALIAGGAPGAGEALGDALAALDRLEGSADGQHPGTGGLCRRARADLLHRAGRRDEAVAALAGAREAAEGDPIELGACHLLEGDLLLAPFSHPDAADHALIESGTESSALPWAIEAQEADAAAADLEGAAAAFDLAESAFARGDGLTHEATGAALALRRGGLARARGDHALAVTLAEHAERAATAAGDGWLATTAAVHAALDRVGAGQVTGSRGAPEEVGSWGAGDGSYAHAFGLGLLLARAGRGWLVRAGDADRAVRCGELAGRLFTALGAGTQSSQCLADVATALAAVGAAPAALLRLERALEEHLARTGDPELGTDAWRRATSLAARIHHLHLAGDDPGALRRSGERLGQLAATAPGTGTDDETVMPLRALAEELHAATEVQVILQEADAARDVGDHEVADERASSALSVAERTGDHLGRAVALARLRRTEEAAAAYASQERSDAADLARRFEELRAQLGEDADPIIAQLDQTGNVLRRAAAFTTRIGAADAAAAAFDRLDAHEPGWPHVEERPWELLSDHGHVREQLGELDRAAALHEAAVSTLEARTARIARDELRTALHGGGGRTFGRAARTELRRAAEADDRLGPHAEAAFVLAERGRARALVQLLSSGTAAPETLDDDHPVRRWAAASARLSLFEQLLSAELSSPGRDAARIEALRGRVTEHEGELARRRDELRAVAPAAATALTPPVPLTVAEVAAALPPDGLLLSHLLVDDDLLVWAIGPEGLVAAERRDVDARSFGRDVLAFASGCASGGPWIEPARRVAELLVGPVEDVIRDRQRLYLVPTGAGHGAPLHALPLGDRLLVDHAPVAVLPSASVLRHLDPPRLPPPPPALVVGDPEGATVRTRTGTAAAAPLPGARLEASAVAARLRDATLLIGAAATADAVGEALGSARLVHLAAHAVVALDAPLATAVLLADGDELTVADLVGRQLAADLVVLSACDSGRGPVTGGEEVLGMTRALLAAGASGAVVSLWPVDDRSTAVLMSRFSEHVAGGLDPSTALQHAQRWFRGLDDDARSRAFAALTSTGSPGGAGHDPAPATLRGIARGPAPELPAVHPFHWAAFVHVGAHGEG